MSTGASTGAERDPFVDFVRAFSLLVVVAWHWVFTIIIWRDDGPHATNPIGFTKGLFVATWLLQVLPLFFFVGGFAHQQAWAAQQASGTRLGTFVWKRISALARPALALFGAWWALGALVVSLYDLDGVGRTVQLIVSPLWFLAVYLLLIALFPLAHRLHQRFGILVVVWAAAIAALVDVGRFAHGYEGLAWVNMVVVWGLCHQLGFFYRQLVDAGRRVAWALTWSGLFALVALVGTRLYPGSMVGVPGERFSNMAPPTVCIVALVFFQIGVVLLVRDAVLERLRTRARWQGAQTVVNRFALPIYLFHSTGMAIWWAFSHEVLGTRAVREPDLRWWLTRPTAFIGPLVVTLPIILVLGRRWTKRPTPERSAAA
ncbi:MAG TPA: acyltransferase [Acidimicrobiales bacterium]|nr:acyltransferase [Acidimicrobiales bacterium]